METITQRLQEWHIRGSEDIIVARQQVRRLAEEMGFSLLDQTRIVTAVSELARNIVVHAEEGTMMVFEVRGERSGLRVVFEDHGPGLGDVSKAMESGYSTAGSLGLGLQGAKKLTDSMVIVSSPGQGTKVTITKWL